MKKILVLLNAELPPFHVINLAISVAKNTQSYLHIVLMEDKLELLEYDYPFPNDLALSMNRLTGKTLSEENKTLLESNLRMVTHQCTSENISFLVDPIHVLSLEKLIEYSIFSDCILADAGENIRESFMDELLVHAHCPVFLVSKSVAQPQNVILAYDGQASSVHAFKMFAYVFPEYRQLPAFLFHVTDTPGVQAIPCEESIRTLLAGHYPALTVKTTPGNAREELLNFVASVQSPLVVMGSFGRNAVSRFFRKSRASSVLKGKNASVFIGHN